MIQELPKTGIILSGGGARAAYQIGVIKRQQNSASLDSTVNADLEKIVRTSHHY